MANLYSPATKTCTYRGPPGAFGVYASPRCFETPYAPSFRTSQVPAGSPAFSESPYADAPIDGTVTSQFGYSCIPWVETNGFDTGPDLAVMLSPASVPARAAGMCAMGGCGYYESNNGHATSELTRAEQEALESGLAGKCKRPVQMVMRDGRTAPVCPVATYPGGTAPQCANSIRTSLRTDMTRARAANHVKQVAELEKQQECFYFDFTDPSGRNESLGYALTPYCTEVARQLLKRNEINCSQCVPQLQGSMPFVRRDGPNLNPLFTPYITL